MTGPAIILDIDNTLLNHSEAEQRAARLFGRQFSRYIPSYDRDSFPARWQEVSRPHIKAYLEGSIDFARQGINRIRDVFGRRDIDKRDALALFGEYLELYEDSWSLFPDVLPFLQGCAVEGIPMGILSDGFQDLQEKKLKKTGITNYFKFVITSESEGMRKPDERLYLRGVELFCIPHEPVYYIGDNLVKDALGATEAGLTGVWLNRRREAGDYENTLRSLDGFRAMFMS